MTKTPLTIGSDGGVIKASVLKPVFTTIEQGLVTRSMGKLADADLRTLRAVIAHVIG